MSRRKFEVACPVPISEYPHVLMAHGGGGRLMHQLLEQMFLPTLSGDAARDRHDSALIEPEGCRLAFTTDSFVVRPLFFPGGDIGSLAVHGTVNDLAMSGARPSWMSAAFILEEGLPMQTLWEIVRSMRRAAEEAGITIVTGDTKVVDKGKGDGVFINTSGVGRVEHSLRIRPAAVKPDDVCLVSGDLARHGIAILNAREDLGLETEIQSDSASLADPVLRLISAGIEIHCLRDLTRGGLAGALLEIAEVADLSIEIEEERIPVREDVRGACELLGLDPVYVANEGRFAAFLPESEADQALEILRGQPLGREARVIGRARTGPPLLTALSTLGVSRVVDRISGEQLPRIC